MTEIMITIWRQPDAEKLKAEVEAEELKTKNNSSNSEKKLELAKYQAETKSIALIIGFTISVIVCCAGIGLLSAVINTTPEDKFRFLRGVDIVLTSGLIAGGSDSFH